VGNNRNHFVAFDASLTDGLASSLRDSMAEDYGPTQLRMVEQARVTSVTDVIAFSADYGDNGAAGWVYCPPDAPRGINPSGDRWCRHQELHLNLNPRYAIFVNDDPSRDHIACHELGHTIGLLHWGNPPESEGPVAATCMNSNTPNGPTTLNEIDLDHIDDYEYRVTPPPPRGLRIAAPWLGSDASLVTGTAGGLVEATGVEHPATLHDLVTTSDAVVHGRIVSVEVDEVLAGTLPEADSTRLTLEIPLYTGPEGLAAVRGVAVGTERVLFLRSKATSAAIAGMSEAAQRAEAGYYRLVTPGSELIAAHGRAEIPPVEAVALESLAGLPFPVAVDRVRSVD
jgi:hypothetical protein